jgi:hypothetical protein
MALDPLPASPAPGDDHARRAAVLTALAVGFAGLTALYVARNLFLAPAFGIATIACAVLAVRSGAPRPLLVALVLLVAVPLLFALVALLFLAMNNPVHLDVNGISFVAEP